MSELTKGIASAPTMDDTSVRTDLLGDLVPNHRPQDRTRSSGDPLGSAHSFVIRPKGGQAGQVTLLYQLEGGATPG